MKRLLTLCSAMLLLGGAAASADDDTPIAFDRLPVAAQTFVGTHFPGIKAAFAKVDRDLLGSTYEVMLADGTKIEFDGGGEWKEVDTKPAAVPAAIIPDRIALYVNSTYPKAAIISIERSPRKYEVELDNGLDVTFDARFNLIGVDD